MRVVRLIIYEGAAAALADQLGSSCADGVRTVRQTVRMSVLTLPLTELTLAIADGELRAFSKSIVEQLKSLPDASEDADTRSDRHHEYQAATERKDHTQ